MQVIWFRLMQDNTNSQQLIRVPTTTVDAMDLIRQLVDENAQLKSENAQLRKIIEENNAVIDRLTNAMAFQQELIQQLRDEIAILKGQKPKPKIPPSGLEGPKSRQKWHERFKKILKPEEAIPFASWLNNPVCSITPSEWFRASKIANANPVLQIRVLTISCLAKSIVKKVKRKRSKPGQPNGKPRSKKKGHVEIHNQVDIHPANIPEGAAFKGFKPYLVQDIVFQPYNTLYRRGIWKLPDGTYLTGQLPEEVKGHYGPELISYVFFQCHVCRVTEPLLLEQLRAKKIKISSGKINGILTKNLDLFHTEVDELLPAGLMAIPQLLTDDTGGRHKGVNQYTTIIGNDYFSIFTTTESKSRINFLKLLQGNKEHYVINEDTIAYLSRCNAARYLSSYIALSNGARFTTLADWKQFLKERNIIQTNDVRFVTEAALFASLFEHGIPRNLLIHSDDAGQFDVALFFNTLCWIHEERHYRKLIMINDQAKSDLERVTGQIWFIYNNLKTYKLTRDPNLKTAIERQFDGIFQQQTSSPTLNHQLQKTFKKKDALLGVLVRPDSPTHNNASETAARKAKTKFKVSGGTRSDCGRAARDTFLSLQQTCLKLGINFIEFLNDRVRGLYKIPRLSEVIRQHAMRAFSAIIFSCFASALAALSDKGTSVTLAKAIVPCSLSFLAGNICEGIKTVFTGVISHLQDVYGELRMQKIDHFETEPIDPDIFSVLNAPTHIIDRADFLFATLTG
jgi:Transposase IS66 family